MGVYKLTEDNRYHPYLNIGSGKQGIQEQESSDMNILLNSSNKEYYTKHFIGVLHHGETQGNVKKDTGKSIHEGLTDNGVEQIKKQAQKYKSMNLDLTNLVVHLPPSVTRNIQTARIFCEELGLDFPKEDNGFLEISNIQTKIDFLKDIIKKITLNENKDFDIIYASEGTVEDRDKTKKELSKLLSNISNMDAFVGLLNQQVEHISRIENLPNLLQNQIEDLKGQKQDIYTEIGLDNMPYIELSDDISTAKKGKSEKGNYYPANIVKQNEYGREPVNAVRIKSANYINKTKYESPDRDHLFIVNRAGVEAFVDVKDNRKDLEYKFNSPTGEIKFGYLNADNKFINQADSKFFEFDFENYEIELKQFENIKGLEISTGKTLLENQNLINEYLENFKKNLWELKGDEGTKYQRLEIELHNKNKILQKHTVYLLLDHINKEDKNKDDIKNNIRNILINWIDTDFSENTDIDIITQISYFKEFYNNKNNTDLWKYILYKIKIQDNNISDELGELSQHKDVEKELGVIDYRTKNRPESVKTFLGDFSFEKIYIQQYFQDEEGETFGSKDFLTKVLNTDKKIISITASGGAGKSIASQYFLHKFLDTKYLFKKDIDVFTQQLDRSLLNSDEPGETESANQSKPKYIIVDAIDEQSEDQIDRLKNVIHKSSKNTHFILFSRSLPDSLSYDQSNTGEEIKDIEHYELEKIEKGQFTKYLYKYLHNILDMSLSDIEDIKLFLDKSENNTPLTIAMISDITRDLELSEEIFDQEHPLSSKLYSIFIKKNAQRAYEKDISRCRKNPYIKAKYNKLRESFLKYIAIYSSGHEFDLKLKFIDYLQKTPEIKEELNKDTGDRGSEQNIEKQIELFLESFYLRDILETPQEKGHKITKSSFSHEVLKDYYGFKAYLDLEKKGERIGFVKDILSSSNMTDTQTMKILSMPYFDDPSLLKKHIEQYKLEGIMGEIIKRRLLPQYLLTLKKCGREYHMGERRILQEFHKDNQLLPTVVKGEYTNGYDLYNKLEIDKILSSILQMPKLDKNNRYIRYDGKIFVSANEAISILYKTQSDSGVGVRQYDNSRKLVNKYNIENMSARSHKFNKTIEIYDIEGIKKIENLKNKGKSITFLAENLENIIQNKYNETKGFNPNFTYIFIKNFLKKTNIKPIFNRSSSDLYDIDEVADIYYKYYLSNEYSSISELAKKLGISLPTIKQYLQDLPSISLSGEKKYKIEDVSKAYQKKHRK